MDHENDNSRRTKSGLLSGTGLLSFATTVVERYLGQVGDLEKAVKEIHAKKTRNEDARKRSFSAKLVTTPNTARIHSRQALIIQEIDELRPLLEKAVGHVAKIEIARHELHEFRAHERKIRRDRKERDQRQLSELTYDFIDCLFSEFGIDGSALSTLEADDYKAIATIVLNRHRTAVPSYYTGN